MFDNGAFCNTLGQLTGTLKFEINGKVHFPGLFGCLERTRASLLNIYNSRSQKYRSGTSLKSYYCKKRTKLKNTSTQFTSLGVLQVNSRK